MKTYFKTILRSIKGNLAKFISLTMIMLLGIAFVAGLGTLTTTIKDSYNKQFSETNISDVIIKSTSKYGFSNDEITLIKNLEYVEAVESVSIVDFIDNETMTRIYSYNSFDNQINKLIVEGNYPSASNEIMVERHSDATSYYKIGDSVTLMGMKYKVVGIVSNPLIFERTGEPSLIDTSKNLEQIFYLDFSYSQIYLPSTDIYLKFSSINNNYFSKKYKNSINTYIEELKEDIGENYVYLTLEDNKSYMVVSEYLEKVDIIVSVFPTFFIVVAALVVMTTMTRLIDEERPQIACLKSLGTSDARIIFKYLFLTASCCLIAAIFGLLLGLLVIPAAILPAFEVIFFMPKLTGKLNYLPGISSFLLMFIVVLLVTFVVAKNRLKEQPSSLLIGKAPKNGKKILLENFPFIWKRLSFKYKSSIRNIFRYKKHLIMTIISVAGATALTFAGFGLANVADSLAGGSFAGLKDAIKPISIVVIVFALLLCIFVIYNLTYLNIGERKKEIATLDVLGYHEIEKSGYIYREIMMMSVVGDIIGIGVGYLLVDIVLKFLEFGNGSDIKIMTYIITFLIIIVFVGITDLLLRKKIVDIDMTSSLKVND